MMALDRRSFRGAGGGDLERSWATISSRRLGRGISEAQID